ncbi:MAG: hypothetical protein AB7P00_20295 [Sandaracinaceae bacterium]
MSRPWQGNEVLLLGHSQMEGMAPSLRARFLGAGARVVHTFVERGIDVAALQREVVGGLRILPRSLADTIPVVVVALSGNGTVHDPLVLQSHLEWLRAEYPRALIAWLGYTRSRTGTAEDTARERAAELEARLVPTHRGVLWIDMRLDGLPLSADGIHHTQDGYRQLADHAWARILRGTRAASASPWPTVALLGALGALLGAAIAYGARRG